MSGGSSMLDAADKILRKLGKPLFLSRFCPVLFAMMISVAAIPDESQIMETNGGDGR
ncbi:MAG: hypothetical protein PHY12_15270 [Eubacteriales bacterium]|nr:hypothetical protein [Eubacteriales bacterium]